MKIKNAFFLTLLSSTILFSCQDDDNEIKGKFDGKPVKFNSEIEKQTRASGITWDTADAIGVYMKTAGQELSATSTLAENKKHTTPGDGTFSFATQENAIYFPEDGSNVDFIAYYPYQTTITDFKYSVDLSGDQTGRLTEIDLMYSNDVTGKNKDADDVILGFSHQLANITLNITDQSGSNLSGLKVTITGMQTKSSFSLVNGVLSNDDNSLAEIIAETRAENSRAVSEAIILPVNALNGAKITFEVPSHNKTYSWDIPANQEYKAKHRYTYDVEIKSDGAVVLNPSSNITNWVDVPGGKIELEGGTDPVPGDGTKENPYTTSQLQDKVGENGKWAKGFVVGVVTQTRASGSFEPPFTIKTNILLAENTNEKDLTNCFIVELVDGTDIQKSLNLVDNEDLLGKEVKIEGNITGSVSGIAVGITAVTAQEGGNKPGGERVEFFKETFGRADAVPSSSKIAAYTTPGYDMVSKGVTYSDPYEGKWADVRTTKTLLETYNMHVWLPAYASNKECGLLIEGIEGGYKDITLSYDIAANLNSGQSIDANVIIVKCNDTAVTVPSTILSTTNTFENISISIPDGTTKIEFYSGSTNDKGIRLDNITLEGTK